MGKESIAARFGSGREVRRIEDAGLLVGAGRFVDDVSLPGQTYLRFLRSPHAHARIASIDVDAARSMPGVIAVLTGADLAAAGVKPIPLAPIFQRPDGSPGATPLRPALALDVVRFVGEAVAAVIAETAESGQGRAGGYRGRIRGIACRRPDAGGDRRGRAAALAGRDRQHRRTHEPRRRRGGRSGVPERRACGRARPRQSAARADADGAARRAGRSTTSPPIA